MNEEYLDPYEQYMNDYQFILDNIDHCMDILSNMKEILETETPDHNDEINEEKLNMIDYVKAQINQLLNELNDTEDYIVNH